MIELKPEEGGLWRLTLQPTSVAHTALSTEPLEYQGRPARLKQNWLRFPVSGVSFKLARAYIQWLASSGRVPGARPCTEQEWERATRGADDRQFAMGMTVGQDDANIDVTYGKKAEATGPDEVGSHPSSVSPFGLHDTLGNANEWLVSSLADEGPALRSGSFVYGHLTGRVENRNITDENYREADTGIRVCASLSGGPAAAQKGSQ